MEEETATLDSINSKTNGRRAGRGRLGLVLGAARVFRARRRRVVHGARGGWRAWRGLHGAAGSWASHVEEAWGAVGWPWCA
jgi:hypothetical protein